MHEKCSNFFRIWCAYLLYTMISKAENNLGIHIIILIKVEETTKISVLEHHHKKHHKKEGFSSLSTDDEKIQSA